MPGQEMIYPYTFTARLKQFPYKWFWNNSRQVRFTAYAIALTLPVFYKISKAVNSDVNKEQWKKIREKRLHGHFDPIHD